MVANSSVCPSLECRYPWSEVECILSGGNRRALVPPFLRELATSRGWAFISADYRLLVPASGQAVLDDVMDVFKHISTHIPQIDCDRIAAFGHSAGAYPALLAAIHAQPKPKVLAMMYGREWQLDGAS